MAATITPIRKANPINKPKNNNDDKCITYRSAKPE